MKLQNIDIQEKEEGIFEVVATIESSIVETYKEKAVVKVHSSAKIKGFRDGKAPRSLIEKTHEPQIRFETVNALFAPLLDVLREEHQMQPMTAPHVEGFEEYKWGDNLTLTLIIENMPTVTNIPQLSTITVEQVEYTYNEDITVQKEIEMLQQLHSHYHDLEEEAQEKDFVKATLSIKGEGINKEEESRYFVLQKDDPYFEVSKTFIGKKLNTPYTETITLSDSFVDKEISGKEITMNFILESGKRVHTPELNDDLAKLFNFDTMDSMKQAVKDAIAKRIKIKNLNKTVEKIYLELAKGSTFVINKAVIMNQTQNDLQNKLQMLISQQKTFDQFIEEKGLTEDNFMDAMAAESRANLEQFLITNSLLKEHNIETTKKEVQDFIEEIISMEFANQQEIRNYYKSNPNQLESLEERLKLRKLAQVVIEKVNIKGSEKVPLGDLREGAL